MVHLRERGGPTSATEARAGLTTFMVMAYILFLNGASSPTAGLGDDSSLDRHVAAGTALVAGIMTIAMGVVANYPFALAAGLGINAIVAFSLTGRACRRRRDGRDRDRGHPRHGRWSWSACERRS